MKWNFSEALLEDVREQMHGYLLLCINHLLKWHLMDGIKVMLHETISNDDF